MGFYFTKVSVPFRYHIVSILHKRSNISTEVNLISFNVCVCACMLIYFLFERMKEFWRATNILIPYFVCNGRLVDWLHKWMRLTDAYTYISKQRAERMSVFCISVEYIGVCWNTQKSLSAKSCIFEWGERKK